MTDKVQFVKADLFETDFSKATVITMFLLPDINLKLRPKILNLRPGTRIVSNSFTMAEWKADQTEQVKDNCTTYCTALLWIVPAKVDGSWQVGDGELKLKQEFQMLTGTLSAGGAETPVKGSMRGDRITFTAGAATVHRPRERREHRRRHREGRRQRQVDGYQEVMPCKEVM